MHQAWVAFYCDILYVWQIVIPIILFSNICKPEEGWYDQPKYFYEKAIPVVMIIFAVVFGLLIYLEVGVYEAFKVLAYPTPAWEDIRLFVDSRYRAVDSEIPDTGFRIQIISGISKVCF